MHNYILTFKFVKGINHKTIQKNTLIYKSKQFTLTKKSTYFRRRCMYIYWTRNCLNFILNMIKLHFLFSFLFCNGALKFIMNSRNIYIYINFKIFKVIISTSKTRLSHHPFNISFSDKFWRSHLLVYSWIPNTTTKGAMETTIQFKQHSATMIITKFRF